MTGAVVPDGVVPLLTTDKMAVVATVRPDGQPATAHVWVDFDGEHLLFSSKTGSRKSRNLRVHPHVAVHVVDPGSKDWIGVRGRVIKIEPDTDLAHIDKLSQRYIGTTYPYRDFEREIYVVEVEHVRSSAG